MTYKDLELFINCHRQSIPEMNIEQLCYLLRSTCENAARDPEFYEQWYRHYRFTKIIDLFNELSPDEQTGIRKKIGDLKH